MNTRFYSLAVSLIGLSLSLAQDPPPGSPRDFGPGPGGPGGPGFGGPPPQTELKILKRFDTNSNKVLDPDERKAALEFIESQPRRGGPGGRGGFGGPRGGGRGDQTPPEPGKKLAPADVKSYADADLYDPAIIRTIFLEFDTPDWEKQMVGFNNTDVDLPAKVTVDGKTYKDVGVHFRGASSFGVGNGRKRSLNLAFDFLHDGNALYGYRTVELLNSHEDPSFLRAVLYNQISRDYIPAPKANFMRVVINGESWGIYANTQPFNKDFVRDNFKTTKGARWKTPGRPGGQASMKYLGDDVEVYKRNYEIKSKDDAKAWTDLIHMFKVLNETAPDKLVAELSPLLDIDGALKFLAVENALVNNDGYWIRSSDYSIYQDEKGKFHVLPHDANETFARPGGPGFGGGRRGGGPGGPRGDFGGGPRPDGPNNPPPNGPGPNGPQDPDRRPPGPGSPGMQQQPIKGVELDPLIAAKDENKPLISKLLAVPELKQRYLGYVRDIAQRWLDWNKLGPVAEQYHKLIADDVKADTRKLDSTEAFLNSLTQDTAGEGGPGPFGRGTIALKNFADQRREYLLGKTNPNN